MSAELHQYDECEGARNRRRRKKGRSQQHHPHDFQDARSTLHGSVHPPMADIAVVGRGEIGFELSSEMRANKQLRKTIREAVRTLDSAINPVGIEAFIENDREAPDHTRIVIEVMVDIESVEEYQSIKRQVREIVRGAERGDIMVYTRISRN